MRFFIIAILFNVVSACKFSAIYAEHDGAASDLPEIFINYDFNEHQLEQKIVLRNIIKNLRQGLNSTENQTNLFRLDLGRINITDNAVNIGRDAEVSEFRLAVALSARLWHGEESLLNENFRAAVNYNVEGAYYASQAVKQEMLLDLSEQLYRNLQAKLILELKDYE